MFDFIRDPESKKVADIITRHYAKKSDVVLRVKSFLQRHERLPLGVGEFGFVTEGGSDYLVWRPSDGSKKGELFYAGPAADSEGILAPEDELKAALNIDGLQWAFLADDYGLTGDVIINSTLNSMIGEQSFFLKTTGFGFSDSNKPYFRTNYVGGRSAFDHVNDVRYFPINTVVGNDAQAYRNFLHYQSTVVALVRAQDDGNADNNYFISTGNTVNLRGITIRWDETNERWVMFTNTSSSHANRYTCDASTSAPNNWELLFFESNIDNCKIYLGTSLISGSDSYTTDSEQGDCGPTSAAVGRWYVGNQWGFAGQWPLMAAFNIQISSAQKLAIVNAVNTYFQQSFT